MRDVGSLFAACVVGLGLYWAWTFFSFNPAIPLATPISLLHVASMAGASASFLLVAFAWRRLSPLCGRSATLVACGALTTLTTPLYLLEGIPQAWAVAGAVVSGFAVAVLVCALAEAFSHLPPADLLSGTALVFLIACALMLAFTLLADVVPHAVLAWAVSALPTLSAVVLVGLTRGLFAPEGLRAGEGRGGDGCGGAGEGKSGGAGGGRGEPGSSVGELLRGLPWRTFVIIACMYLAIGSMRLYVERTAGALTMGLGCLAACIVLLALVAVATQYVGRRRPIASLGVFYKVALPLVIVGYVVLLSADRQASELISVITQLVSVTTECLCWVLIVESVRERGVPALFVIGVGRFVVQLGMSMGELVGLVWFDDLLPVGIATVFLLVLAFVFLFSDRETSVRLDADEPLAAERRADGTAEPGDVGGTGGARGLGGAGGARGARGLGGAGGAKDLGGAGGASGRGVQSGELPGVAGDVLVAGKARVLETGAPMAGGVAGGAVRAGGSAAATQVGERLPPELEAWDLTDRERAVLDLWVTSHGLRSIAATLNVSESTVKTHVRHIYEKCGVHSRAELIALLDEHSAQ